MENNNSPIVILSKTNQISFEYLKYFFNDLFGRVRGPKAVEQSLIRGLKQKGISFELNPRKIPENAVVHVLSGEKVLQEVLDLKKNGRIKTLIVGPNFNVIPLEEHKMITDPNIDAIVFPCQWIKDFYLSFFSDLNERQIMDGKIFVWPSGVKDPGEKNKVEKENDFLIYVKNDSNNLVSQIEKILKDKNFSFKKIIYGQYTPKDFFSNLERTRACIFLSKSETQGLAMQEAWMRNVPTLVWNNKEYQTGKYFWHDEKISAPYLNEECGMFFEDEKVFLDKFDEFIRGIKKFSARKYCLRELSDSASVDKWFDIIKKYV